MVRRARLDAELVRRGLARSREQAVALIAAGRVEVADRVAVKAGTGIDPTALVRVREDPGDPGYASRGGYKLAAALTAFGATDPPLVVAGRPCLDAGASTGGFTDVLLRSGAATVHAVDVGYGQLAWSLRTDPRVVVHDRLNVRTLTPEVLGGQVELTVADLSFISLRLVLESLWRCTTPTGDLVVLVKPQFEVGRDAVGERGVVRAPQVRAAAVCGVAERAQQLGLGCRGLLASPLPGPAGNVEFLLWLAAGAPPLEPAVVRQVTGAPQPEVP
ncbi:MAG: TlyA family RNA methyltransferase [Mycobacteriales bacterium]